MKKENKIEELNYENFNIFVLGYDLLQKHLNNLNLDVDTSFNVCCKVYDLFLKSDYNDEDKSEYECLKDFTDNLSIDELISIIYPKPNVSVPKFQYYYLSMYVEDNKYNEILRRSTIWFDNETEKNWENIIKEFNYYCNRAKSSGYYSGYEWNVSLRKMNKVLNGELVPSKTILKMDKTLYQKYKNIIDYPVVPNVNMHLVGFSDKNECYKYELVDCKNELYYDQNGNVPKFKLCAEAWEYIFQNNLIK